MELNALTTEMMMVMAMIGIAIFLFIVEWIRVDMVAILMTVSLPLLHLVTPKEAFSGFSSNAVISIIAVIIIGAGLDKTGLINRLVAPVLKVAGHSSSRVIIAMGAQPDESLVAQLAGSTAEVHRIGDCRDVGYIDGAILDARKVVQRIS